MHPLALSQTAHIMEARIKREAAALITLDTSARLHLTFEHEYAPTLTGKQTGTHQPTETASYDDHIVLHAFRRLSHLKIAGCNTYDKITADNRPTNVENPTERMAG